MAIITRKILNFLLDLFWYLTAFAMLALLYIGLVSQDAKAATCSSISRTNSSANSVLTSTKYNTDLNTVYTAANALDAGCLTDGTLEASALNSSDFSVVLNGIRQGCKVSYSDSNTLSVGKCILSINGTFVKTTGANTVTWLCSGCSSESSSTKYYLYAKTGSTGTTLNLLISTTAPNEDGYDNSGNRILASFFNDSASAIVSQSITHWLSPGTWEYVRSSWTAYTPTTTGLGTVSNVSYKWRRVGDSIEIHGQLTAGTVSANPVTFTIPSGLALSTTDYLTSVTLRQTFGWIWLLQATPVIKSIIPSATSNTLGICGTVSGSDCAETNGSTLMSSNERIMMRAIHPITAFE